MVSNYSLRPVYTFLYTIINGDVIASVVQKKKSFEISWPPKPLPPLCTQTCTFGLTPLCPPPLCARTMWMTPVQLDLTSKQLLILTENNVF